MHPLTRPLELDVLLHGMTQVSVFAAAKRHAIDLPVDL